MGIFSIDDPKDAMLLCSGGLFMFFMMIVYLVKR